MIVSSKRISHYLFKPTTSKSRFKIIQLPQKKKINYTSVNINIRKLYHIILVWRNFHWIHCLIQWIIDHFLYFDVVVFQCTINFTRDIMKKFDKFSAQSFLQFFVMGYLVILQLINKYTFLLFNFYPDQRFNSKAYHLHQIINT